MATTQIKDGFDGGSDNQLKVNSDGSINVNGGGGGGGSINSWSNFGQSTPKQVAVTNATTQLLAANGSRLAAIVVNNSSQTIYLQLNNSAVFQQGIPIRPNGYYEFNSTNLFLGIVNAITNMGSVNIDVIEGTS